MNPVPIWSYSFVMFVLVAVVVVLQVVTINKEDRILEIVSRQPTQFVDVTPAA